MASVYQKKKQKKKQRHDSTLMNPLWLLQWHFAANGIFTCVTQSIYNALSSAQLTHTCALFIEPPPLLRCIIMFYGSLHLLIPPNYHPAKSQCLSEQTTGQAALWEQHQSHLAGASDKPKPTITIYSGFVTPLHPPQKTLHPHLPAEKHQMRISSSSCQIKSNILLVFCCREKWLLYQTRSSLLSWVGDSWQTLSFIWMSELLMIFRGGKMCKDPKGW